MDTIQDFEDILELFSRHRVRYLIVGGLAFIYHAKPRYTKDIDLWIDSDPANVGRANRALEEFGSPMLMTVDDPDEILQLGVAPNRIDLLRETITLSFDEAWPRRIESHYGAAPANWIDLDSLLAIKSAIDHPRHQEDARILRAVRDRQKPDE
jgi:plasmid maintenance system antidote protein VapI